MTDRRSPTLGESRPGRVVVSSVTGKPMEQPARRGGPRIVPNRTEDDAAVDSNDDRLRQDVPPHWGR